MSNQPRYGSPSPSDAFAAAINTTRELFFNPLNFRKWIGLGLLVFLVNCGRYTGSQSFDFNSPFGGGGAGMPFNLFAVPVFVIIGFFVMLAILGLYIGSLFELPLLRNLRDRTHNNFAGAMSEYSAQAHSLFIVRLVIYGFGSILLVGGGFAVYNATIVGDYDLSGMMVFLLFVAGTAIGITTLLIGSFISNITVPIMFVRSSSFLPAWNESMQLLKAETTAILLYFLLRIAVLIGTTVLVGILTLVSCCLVVGLVFALPVVNVIISTIVFLPLYIFPFLFNLHFLEQFGEDYRILSFAGPVGLGELDLPIYGVPGQAAPPSPYPEQENDPFQSPKGPPPSPYPPQPGQYEVGTGPMAPPPTPYPPQPGEPNGGTAMPPPLPPPDMRPPPLPPPESGEDSRPR